MTAQSARLSVDQNTNQSKTTYLVHLLRPIITYRLGNESRYETLYYQRAVSILRDLSEIPGLIPRLNWSPPLECHYFKPALGWSHLVEANSLVTYKYHEYNNEDTNEWLLHGEGQFTDLENDATEVIRGDHQSVLLLREGLDAAMKWCLSKEE